MKGFLWGFGFGVAAGMLMAPMRGEDIRVMAQVRASEMADTARGAYDQVQGTVERVVTSIRGDESEQTSEAA
jgi:gas vesicle protein